MEDNTESKHSKNEKMKYYYHKKKYKRKNIVKK